MCNTEIGKFCTEHEDWPELLTQEPYSLMIKEDDKYVMFNYDQIRSDFNNSLVREARGIIFRKGKWEAPVCWAFNKFGNYGESYVPDIDWDTAFVTEKIDGSLIKLWWDGDWHVSTNSTINAFKAEIYDVKMHNFGDYFMTALSKYYNSFDEFVSGLETHRTYMFELVGPYNRVVIPYTEPELYFLGARNKFTGEEYNCSSIIAGALGLGVLKRPRVFPLTSLEECLKVTEGFSWDQEGFVVADAHFNRVKVKSPSYVLAHFMRNNNVITKKHLIRVVIENEVAEFLCYASDYKNELLEVQKQINGFLNIGNTLAVACRALADRIERADYAVFIKALPNIYQGLLFCNYDKPMTAEEFTSKWNENKWEEYLESFEKLMVKYFKVVL